MLDHVAEVVADRLTVPNLAALGLLLLTAIVSAFVTYFRTTEHASLRDFLSFAFPPEALAHPSAKADFLFWITKKAITPLLFLPAGITFVVAIGWATRTGLMRLFGIGQIETAPAGPVLIVVFTGTMLLAYDLSYYLYHLAQHRFPVLWELHKVHHSAEILVGVTKDRVHPLDELLNRMWDGLIPGVCYGLWSLVALDPVEVSVFGINVYVMRNILMMDFVRHTHLPISFGPVDRIVISPHAHQLHHSTNKLHFDKNFGLMFPFWDRLFGTFMAPSRASVSGSASSSATGNPISRSTASTSCRCAGWPGTSASGGPSSRPARLRSGETGRRPRAAEGHPDGDAAVSRVGNRHFGEPSRRDRTGLG